MTRRISQQVTSRRADVLSSIFHSLHALHLPVDSKGTWLASPYDVYILALSKLSALWRRAVDVVECSRPSISPRYHLFHHFIMISILTCICRQIDHPQL
jgi:hypothetical protein